MCTPCRSFLDATCPIQRGAVIGNPTRGASWRPFLKPESGANLHLCSGPVGGVMQRMSRGKPPRISATKASCLILAETPDSRERAGVVAYSGRSWRRTQEWPCNSTSIVFGPSLITCRSRARSRYSRLPMQAGCRSCSRVRPAAARPASSNTWPGGSSARSLPSPPMRT